MNSFEQLSYATMDGGGIPCRTGDKKYPFLMPWQAPLVLPHLRWIYDGHWVELKFKSYAQAVIDPNFDFLIVVTGADDFHKPGNAAAFNPDGTLNHQISPPEYIEHSLGGGPLKRFFVERIEGVRIQDEKVRVDLVFRYEWIEERYYNSKKREWSGRLSVNRK